MREPRGSLRASEALEASLPARVLRAAHAPIQHCFLTESVFEVGMGTLVLARGATPRFGRDGKPVYIPDPSDTGPLIQRRIAQLQKHLGDDGFGFETAA